METTEQIKVNVLEQLYGVKFLALKDIKENGYESYVNKLDLNICKNTIPKIEEHLINSEFLPEPYTYREYLEKICEEEQITKKEAVKKYENYTFKQWSRLFRDNLIIK